MNIKREDFDALVRVGSQLSNIAFNLGQGYVYGSKEVEADTLKSMYNLDRAWHEALQAIRSKARAAKVRKPVKA